MRHLEEAKLGIDHMLQNNPSMGFGKAYKNKVLGKLNLKQIGLDEKIFFEGKDDPDRDAWDEFYKDLKVHSKSKQDAKQEEENAKKLC